MIGEMRFLLTADICRLWPHMELSRNYRLALLNTVIAAAIK